MLFILLQFSSVVFAANGFEDPWGSPPARIPGVQYSVPVLPSVPGINREPTPQFNLSSLLEIQELNQRVAALSAEYDVEIENLKTEVQQKEGEIKRISDRKEQLKLLLEESLQQYSVAELAVKMSDADIASVLGGLEPLYKALKAQGFTETDLKQLSDAIDTLQNAFHKPQVELVVATLNNSEDEDHSTMVGEHKHQLKVIKDHICAKVAGPSSAGITQ